jgi:hypothetical protein
MPTISSIDLVLAAANDLIMALQNPSPLAPTTDSQTAALKQLADIFLDCTKRSPLLDASPEGASEPRVAGAAPRVDPSNAPTPAPTPMVPPGFSTFPEQTPTPCSTHTIAPPVTHDATAPRVPTPIPQAPTYENTAKSTTRRRRRRGKGTKQNTDTPPNATAVANTIQGTQKNKILPLLNLQPNWPFQKGLHILCMIL